MRSILCWLGLHKGIWKEIDRGGYEATYWSGGKIQGKVIVLERECLNCGFKQIELSKT